jgi:Cu2+-exporting ATPase
MTRPAPAFADGALLMESVSTNPPETRTAPEDRCTLCDLPTPDPPITDEAVDGRFCCAGCREIYRTLGDLDAEAAASVRERMDGTADASASVPDDAAEAFVHVEGMHCTACEAFLETLAEREDGVYRAEASYASEMIRMRYDAAQTRTEDLPALLTRGGYRASLERTEADTANEDSETVVRLVLGGFFAMMVMMGYIVFFYPEYAGYASLLDLDGSDGLYALGNTAVFTTVVLAITGWPLLRGAWVSLRVLRPNMDLLISIAALSAYLYSIGAILVGRTEVYFDVTVVIVMAVTIGRWFERRVKRRATGRLAELTREQVTIARRVQNAGTDTVDVDALAPGDRVLVKEGERIPIDGRVVEGEAPVDEALLTGESVPVTKRTGDEVLGGTIVRGNALVVAVSDAAESTLDRLVRLMWEIQAATPGTQHVADRIAAVFVPLVLVLAAGAVGIQLAGGMTASYALLTGLTVLIVSCPCALGLATPLAVASGTRAALDRSIVVKNAGVFEVGSTVDTVVFDKTGTLTTGRMQVIDAVGSPKALRQARAIEQRAAHPVAAAIAASGEAGGTVTQFQSHRRAVTATIDDTRVFVGHPDAYRERGGTLPDALARRMAQARDDGHVPVVVGWGGMARGGFVVGDAVRDEADRVLDRLRTEGRRLAVCTGDQETAAAPLQADARIGDVFAEVRPEAKRALLQRWRRERGPIAMVGDGTNDAPALADADVGIAFGPTALAADSADVVILDDDLERVPDVFAVARGTRRRIRQNLGWAFGYNAIAIPLAALGLLNPLAAALAMASSSILVVVNSSRRWR